MIAVVYFALNFVIFMKIFYNEWKAGSSEDRKVQSVNIKQMPDEDMTYSC